MASCYRAKCVSPVKKLGLAPNNESYVINALQFIGLIDEEGLEDTTVLLRLHLPEEFLVLNNEETMIDRVCFFGATLWTNFS